MMYPAPGSRVRAVYPHAARAARHFALERMRSAIPRSSGFVARTLAIAALAALGWMLTVPLDVGPWRTGEARAEDAPPARLHRYTVSVDPELTVVRVRACFDGRTPLYLNADSLDAAGVLQEARIEPGNKRLEPNGAELKLGQQPDGACVHMTSAIAYPSNRHVRERGPGRRVGTDVIADVALWLWRPGGMGENEDIELRFELPDGVNVSAPWRPQPAAPGEPATFRLGRAPSDWPAVVAFGQFTPREIDVAGARLRVAVLHGSPAPDWAFIERWLTQSARAAATLYGRFPVDDAQVLVVPGARGSEPVPSAYVLRGGQPSLHFFINQRRSEQEFMQDWSAVHEMSHLFLPFVRPQDAWVSEGLASYMQNVLRARAGMITAEEGWRQMHRSFRLGARSMPEMTLADATERMHRDGAYMRVYWEGAALMLIGDQRLRERTAGRESLDSVLEKFHACCMAAPREWTGRALLERFDALSGTSVFSEIDQFQASQRYFPDLRPTYTQLGLDWSGGGDSLSLLPTAPRLVDREAIMASPARPAGTP